jgi:hypothetical protein
MIERSLSTQSPGSLAPPLPTGAHWAAGQAKRAAHAEHAEQAEKRLRNALHELKRRGEHVVEEVRMVAPSLRVVGIAVLAGLGAVLFLGAVRWAAKPRARRNARVRAPKRRSLAGELVARVALGAAGVLGARLASDVLMPALERRLEAPRSRHHDDDDDE